MELGGRDKFMGRKFSFIRSGYCPTQDDHESIEIETHEIRMAGNPAPGYKKMLFRCDHATDYNCEIANDCPIFWDAPSNPHLA
jgi:hypothetical protein